MKKEVKTLWAGRAWVHAKYLNECTTHKIPLQLVHSGDTMTIPYESFKEKFDRNKIIKDNFKAGLTHKQYGIVWRSDKEPIEISPQARLL